MILWRISNYADLLGTGSMTASARWHTQSRPIVYLAENPSAALLETIVHLEIEEEDRPDSYQLLKIEKDDSIRFDEVPIASLPANWKSAEAITRNRGDRWLEACQTALLRVPSVITPETWSWLLNPRHSDSSRVRGLAAETQLYDLRLVRSSRK